MTLKEHIDDISRRLGQNIFKSEAAVRQGIVDPLLRSLGWPTDDTLVVFPEYPVGSGQVDYALCHPSSTPRVFIEAKQVGNIKGAEEQLFGYDSRIRVPIAVLTDGREWQFFHPTGEGTWAERKVCELDLITGESAENAEILNRYLNCESIRTGEAVEAIKADYEKVVQQRQVEARLPEVWNELVRDKNEDLLLIVMDAGKNKIGYEPTEEQVLDFLKSLKQKKEIKPPPKRKHLTRNPGLFVTMPDGEIINHKVSATTFVEVIEKLGIERVKNLNKEDIIPLISIHKNDKYTQRQSGQYYIMTHNSTKKKKQLLEEIATELRESLKV
ncbi:MAG: type I restriction enzyme HsdR N-terminal domain-containing protein, partial [Candidatus Poribacteria bacterium]|nr:type I restriction enzyme HsdR N-terminal domain-containing protein [Candidatus Poribacteria bacterium]